MVSLMKNGLKHKVSKKWFAYFVGCTISLLFILGSYLYYTSEAKSTRNVIQREIHVTAELKIGPITQWRKERIRHVENVSREEFLTRIIHKSKSKRGKEIKSDE